MLQHHVVQATERDHERIEGKTRASDSVDPSRIAQWTGELSDDDRKVLSGAAARVGEFYGYSMEDPEALAPLGNPRSLLFGGKGLRKRIERFSDLDIYTQMPVPLYDHRLDPRHFELKRLNETASQKLMDRVRARVRR